MEIVELAKTDAAVAAREVSSSPEFGFGYGLLGTLLLRCCRNILMVRSESGRTIGWAQAHFFVAAGGDEHSTGLGRGVFK